MRGDLGSDFSSQALLTAMNSPDGLQQFLSQQTFQEITLSAGL